MNESHESRERNVILGIGKGTKRLTDIPKFLERKQNFTERIKKQNGTRLSKRRLEMISQGITFIARREDPRS